MNLVSGRWRVAAAAALAASVLVGCGRTPPQPARAPPSTQPQAAAPAPATRTSYPPSPPLVRAARRQIGTTVRYDPAYATLAYPGGDVPPDRGVCTDVVVRALRTQGLDLQREIHLDRRAHPRAYPAPGTPVDRNIDHRRVPNQMAWFARQGWGVPAGDGAGDVGPGNFRPGDIVAWRLRGSGLLHIGIVSDRTDTEGVPLVLHNIGAGTREDRLLFEHPVIGHYRPPARYGAAVPDAPSPAAVAPSTGTRATPPASAGT